jgi:phosphosulfolactate synthase (CoM biosynthesis protein A)
MFGFNEDYSLGHDIFSDDENIVVFPNGNILTDKVYYSELNDEYITFTNDAIDSGYISDIKEFANDILEVSNGIIKYDLIKRIGKDVGNCEEKR